MVMLNRGEKQSPVGLAGIELLGFVEEFKIFVICDGGL